jgi:hypothetical protein
MPDDVMEPDVLEPDDPEAGVPARLRLLRRPDVPVSLSDLAALKGEAIEIIEARVQILKTVRLAALRMTLPEDWVLFKAPDEHGGQIVGYLQDCGADRVRDIFGIRVFDVTQMEKIVAADGTHFMYLVSGSGLSSLTRQTVSGIEGGRSSTDDFCKDKTGAALELLVRKAARANLDGNVTRELAGLKSVPIEEITEAWVGTSKKIDRCRRGRGFGTASERLGANSEKAPDVAPPVCPHCKAIGKYRPAKGTRSAFYGCPKYDTHPQQKWIVDAAQWIAEQAKTAPPAPSATLDPGVGSDGGSMADANPFKNGR